MTTPSASIATNSRPMAVSEDRRVRRVTSATPPIITTAPTAAPSDPGQAEQDRGRDARQHAVRERVAEEREPAQDDERAHDGAGDRDEHAGEQRPQHEAVVDEGLDQRSHAAPMPALTGASVDVRPRLNGSARGLRGRPVVSPRGERATRGHVLLAHFDDGPTLNEIDDDRGALNRLVPECFDLNLQLCRVIG